MTPYQVTILRKDGTEFVWTGDANTPPAALKKAWMACRGVKWADGHVPPSWAKATVKRAKTQETSK